LTWCESWQVLRHVQFCLDSFFALSFRQSLSQVRQALAVQAVSKLFADFHAFGVDQEIGQKLVVCMSGNHAVQSSCSFCGTEQKAVGPV